MSSFISASVVPVVLINACGLLCLAFYNRLVAIVARLRTFHRERLHEIALSEKAQDPVDKRKHGQVLSLLGQQIEAVMRRARLIRRTLQLLLSTIVGMILCSLLSGVSTHIPNLGYVAVSIFILSMCCLLLGVCFAIAEMAMALKPIELESGFLSGVSVPGDATAAAHAEHDDVIRPGPRSRRRNADGEQPATRLKTRLKW